MPNKNTASEVLHVIPEITAVTIDKECKSNMEHTVLVEVGVGRVRIMVESQDGYNKPD